MGFISVLLTIFFVLWLLGFIFRIALRAWLLKQQHRFAQNFSQHNAQKKQQRPEGSVEIQKTNQTPKSVAKQVGEYVEFEEEKLNSNQ